MFIQSAEERGCRKVRSEGHLSQSASRPISDLYIASGLQDSPRLPRSLARKFICIPSFFSSYTRFLWWRHFLPIKIMCWRFSPFRNTRNLDTFSPGYRGSRGKVRSVTFFSRETAQFICIPSFFSREIRVLSFLWWKIYPLPLSLARKFIWIPSFFSRKNEGPGIEQLN